MIYFDYSANTQASEEVLSCFLETERACTGNAQSRHSAGKAVQERINQALHETARLIGVLPEEIIFTSGATESNNLAVRGIAEASVHIGKHIISSPLEHSSLSAVLSYLQARGYEIDLLPLDKNGMVDLEELQDLMRTDTCLVAVSLADSEVGIRQPVEQIRTILADYPQCRFHIDATQAVGKTEVPFSCADTISFSAHKFYGLNGIGVLVKKKDVSLRPQMLGGSSTTIYRSGTPAPGLICSLVPALREALENLETNREYVRKLNVSLREKLQAIPSVSINSPSSSLPHILNIGISGLKGYETQQLLDEEGICVSVKSACTSDYLPSKSVLALTGNRKRASEAFRVSLSHLTTPEETELLYMALVKIAERAQTNG